MGYDAPMQTGSLAPLSVALEQFAAERDWGPYHTPKNLAAALAVEAAELLEPFQWLTAEESAALDPVQREAVAQELADVLLYTVRLADRLGVDLHAAAAAKLALNAAKYPVDKARGNATKAGRWEP